MSIISSSRNSGGLMGSAFAEVRGVVGYVWSTHGNWHAEWARIGETEEADEMVISRGIRTKRKGDELEGKILKANLTDSIRYDMIPFPHSAAQTRDFFCSISFKRVCFLAR